MELGGLGASHTGPGVALLGCGIFARDAYIPIIRTLHPDHLSLSCVWSRSQAAANTLLEIAREFAPGLVAKWGDQGLMEIFACQEVHCCLVVLPVEVQPSIVLRALGAGKHVLQEKPIAPTVTVGLDTLIAYKKLMEQPAQAPIWAVAENYRFEKAFHEAGRIVRGLGTMVVVEVIVEVQMLSSNKYFNSNWRRELKGGFITDCGVHFVAGLRLITGRNVVSVSAIASHRNKHLPPPDNLSALLKFDDGCSGIMVISYAASANKATWRAVCSEGTVEVERVKRDGDFGYTVTLIPLRGSPETTFYPFMGMEEEIRSFVSDVQKGRDGVRDVVPDQNGSPLQGLQDLCIIEAALESGLNAVRPLIVESLFGQETMLPSNLKYC